MFDEIYAADLRYLADCWKLCGDAHCCSFSRYKARFRILARKPFQELPLLPGEFEYLSGKGWLAQFGDYERRILEVPLDVGIMRVESVVSWRPGCACNQETRPTICRLYPLLPLYDTEGRVVGVESTGIYEVLEELGGLEPACRLTAIPFPELQKWHAITAAIGRCPVAVFYLMAYHLTKMHVRERLAAAHQTNGRDVFALFETMLLRKQLIDHGKLRAELNELASFFRDRYGDAFQLT